MQTIKTGSIVELDGKKYKLTGDAVEVAPITELEVGARYRLMYSGKFCHAVSTSGLVDDFKGGVFIFVGTIDIFSGERRNIFYGVFDNPVLYAMFNADNLDYVIEKL
jgi:hypothetical protein